MEIASAQKTRRRFAPTRGSSMRLATGRRTSAWSRPLLAVACPPSASAGASSGPAPEVVGNGNRQPRGHASRHCTLACREKRAACPSGMKPFGSPRSRRQRRGRTAHGWLVHRAPVLEPAPARRRSSSRSSRRARTTSGPEELMVAPGFEPGTSLHVRQFCRQGQKCSRGITTRKRRRM